MQRTKMRFVDLIGYEPGPHSPKKPSDVGFPEFPDAIYPAVVEHPVSGRKVLEVVEQFLDRVADPEEAGMWEPGDMILWDNWRAMHCTTGTRPGIERVINRTTIEGHVAPGRQATV